MDNTNHLSYVEKLRRSELRLIKTIEILEKNYELARYGSDLNETTGSLMNTMQTLNTTISRTFRESRESSVDFKRLNSLKQNLDEKYSRLKALQDQIMKYEKWIEKLEKGSLEATMTTFYQTNKRSISQMRNDQSYKLLSMKKSMDQEYKEKECELNDRYLFKRSRSSDATQLLQKIEQSCKKEKWKHADYYQKIFKDYDRRDEENDFYKNRRLIDSKLYKLRQEHIKQLDEEQKEFKTEFQEKNEELRNVYQTHRNGVKLKAHVDHRCNIIFNDVTNSIRKGKDTMRKTMSSTMTKMLNLETTQSIKDMNNNTTMMSSRFM